MTEAHGRPRHPGFRGAKAKRMIARLRELAKAKAMTATAERLVEDGD